MHNWNHRIGKNYHGECNKHPVFKGRLQSPKAVHRPPRLSGILTQTLKNLEQKGIERWSKHRWTPYHCSPSKTSTCLCFLCSRLGGCKILRPNVSWPWWKHQGVTVQPHGEKYIHLGESECFTRLQYPQNTIWNDVGRYPTLGFPSIIGICRRCLTKWLLQVGATKACTKGLILGLDSPNTEINVYSIPILQIYTTYKYKYVHIMQL